MTDLLSLPSESLLEGVGKPFNHLAIETDTGMLDSPYDGTAIQEELHVP